MSEKSFHCAEHIKWVNDSTQVVIIDEMRNQTHILQGEEAAVWSWLTLGYSYERILPLVAALWTAEPQVANHKLAGLLTAWHSTGLLEETRRTI